MLNIVLFGKPGAGKGTQAEFLKSKYQLVHLSTGDLFRKNISEKTQLGLLAQSYMDKGDLVPDQVTIDMLETAVKEHPQAKGFIFDGFPRTKAQAEALDAFLEKQIMMIKATIALEADDSLLVERLLERGKTSGRSDDQDVQKITNRFQEYDQKTAPVKKYYQSQKKFYSINGIGTIPEITQRLSAMIETL